MAHTKALIIEDNENNMELMTFLLELNRYEVIKAFTALEGIEAALHQSPDFVLLDIQLPDMDGSDALLEIRRRETGSPLPIIAVTSYAMSGDRERLLARGCSGYIEKPINPETIIRDIQTILESYPCKF